jgi:hypothetical protein
VNILSELSIILAGPFFLKSLLITSSKRAFSYNTDLLEGMKFLFDEVRARRSWISSKWTDTPEGQGKEIRALDYACGTGNLSRVST